MLIIFLYASGFSMNHHQELWEHFWIHNQANIFGHVKMEKKDLAKVKWICIFLVFLMLITHIIGVGFI